MIPSEKQWGRLAAVNLDTGKLAWKADTEQPLIGGVLATAGDLVFTGEGNGNFNASTPRPARSCGRSMRRRRQRTAGLLHGQRQAVHCHGRGGNVQLDFKRGNSLFVYTLGD